MKSSTVLLLTMSLAQASVVVREVTFRPSQFHAEFAVCSLQFAGGAQLYDRVLGEEMDVTDEAGAPQLPVLPVVIALAGRQQVTSVAFEVGRWEAMRGKYSVMPAQKQMVLMQGLGTRGEGLGKAEFTQPNQAIYGSRSPYPAAVARWTGTSYRRSATGTATVLRGSGTGTVFLGGKQCQSPYESTFVQVLVCPVKYVGAEGRIEVCREVKVEVEVQTKSEGRSSEAVSCEPSAVGPFEYVVVTGAGLDTVFQRLADWKTQKGVPAVVRNMDWVYAYYTGRDQAEQLRSYLKTLPDSGVRYVLLGGDVDVVPFRKTFAMACEWGAHPREDSLPCDLYFGDLDGSWDANGNGVFGEVDDSVDLYADLSVGRAPVSNVVQAQTFVRKVIDYEQGTVTGYQNRGLFFAEILWQNPYTDQGVHKDKMERQSFASGYSLTKLYQSLGNETREAVMQAMREGQNFLNHDGHGWIDVMQCGGSAHRLYTADADTVTNAGLGVLYSIGCWTTAFDFTSIGEAFVTNPRGGTVATIGNASYGWGSPGNPGFGYSDKFDSRFWHAVTSEGRYRAGDALMAAKEYYAPFSHERNVYRWHQYEVNLMGDPELPIWTALPETLAVVAPLSVGIGPGRYLFSVMRAGEPVPGALVCMAKPGEVYSRGLTDDAGRVWLDIAPETPGRLILTVTAQNCLPWQGEVACDNGSYVNFAGWRVDDRSGNADGIANPGETVGLPLALRNTGNARSGVATLMLATTDSLVAILDSTVSVPGLDPGDSVLVDSGLKIRVSARAQDAAAVRFRLDIFDCCLATTFFPVLQVGAPVLALDRTWLCRPPLLPGAGSGLKARLRNRGHGYGHGVWCRLVSLDPYITVAEDSIWLGEVAPLSYAGRDSFLVAATGACPAGHVALLELRVNAAGFAGCDTFGLLVGEYGFSDDLESGEAKWSHGGAGDLWHLTSYRKHSGANAWYCGDQGTRRYNNRMDAWLTTTPFAAGQNCSLAFWRWFATPNYGVDGIRVIVVRGTVEETLDFLGSGGALPKRWSSGPMAQWPSEGTESEATKPQRTRTEWRSSGGPESGTSGARPLLLNEGGWAEEKYDLSWLAVGETIQVKLVFASDGDTVDEGFYIDDVRVTGGGPPLVGIAGVESAPGPVAALDAWPSPFRRIVNIRCGGSLAQVRPQLGVYDASGRLVKRLPSLARTTWDGRDGSGQPAPSGAYFIVARAGAQRRSVPVLLAR